MRSQRHLLMEIFNCRSFYLKRKKEHHHLYRAGQPIGREVLKMRIWAVPLVCLGSRQLQQRPTSRWNSQNPHLQNLTTDRPPRSVLNQAELELYKFRPVLWYLFKIFNFTHFTHNILHLSISRLYRWSTVFRGSQLFSIILDGVDQLKSVSLNKLLPALRGRFGREFRVPTMQANECIRRRFIYHICINLLA